MGLQLASDLSFCLVEDRLIFLDLAQDRYFRLQPEDERAFLDMINGSGDIDIASLPADFPMRRRLRHAPMSVRPRPVDAPACRRAFIPDPAASPPFIQTLVALIGQLRASRLVHHRPLAIIVRRLRSMRATGESKAGRAAEIVRAHAMADLLYSPHDRCLAKSIALFVALRRSGIGARLILGVAARPFAAHCWIQLDDRVLNGDIEVTRLFVPILVI